MATNTLILSDENSFNVSFAGDSSIGISVDNTNPQSVIGDLSTLTTDAQDTLVNAINEVDSHADTNASAIGTLANLTTTAKTNLVSAINEVNSKPSGGASAIINTATGTIASFSDGSANTLQSLTVGIEPVQDLSNGDPSPTNICPITGHTDADVYRTGVNLWDEEWELATISWSDYKFTPSSSGGRLASKNYIPVIEGATYYFKCPTAAIVCGYSDDSGNDGVSLSGSPNVAITIPSGIHYIKFGAYEPDYGTTYNNDISINYPSTDTSYHAYVTPSTLTLSWQTEAGTVYGGSVTVAEDGSAVLTVTKAFYTFDGDESITVGTASTGVQYAMVSDQLSKALGTGVISNQYESVSAPPASGSTGIRAMSGATSIYIYDDRFTDLATCQTLLASNPVQIAYDLYTPLTYTLSSVSQLSSLYGNNNVFNTTGDTTVSYIADTKLYIDEAIATAVANI